MIVVILLLIRLVMVWVLFRNWLILRSKIKLDMGILFIEVSVVVSVIKLVLVILVEFLEVSNSMLSMIN